MLKSPAPFDEYPTLLENVEDTLQTDFETYRANTPAPAPVESVSSNQETCSVMQKDERQDLCSDEAVTVDLLKKLREHTSQL